MQESAKPKSSRWRMFGIVLGSVVLLIVGRLFLISPNPAEALRIVQVIDKLESAKTSDDEWQTFNLARSKTRIWEMSFKDANGQPISWKQAEMEPSQASAVCIEWLGLIRDTRIEHKLITPTNLLVLVSN